MGHEDDSSGAVIDGIFDGWKGADDALVVGHLLVLVQGDVEVDLNLTSSQYLLLASFFVLNSLILAGTWLIDHLFSFSKK